MNPAAAAEPPVARGLFLCDTLIIDAQTKKVSLINLFDRVTAAEFPTSPRPFVAYTLLTGGAAEVELSLQIESVDGLHYIHEQRAVVRFANKVTAMHVRFNVNECSFPVAGVYQAVLYADREPVAQTRFDVVAREE